MKRPNWKLYYKMNRIGLWFILLCFVGVFILFLFLYDSTYPVFKYSLLYISIIAYSILIASTLGLIIIIKSWKNKSLSTLSNHRKILYSLSFLLLSFLILSSIEYLIYINDKDKFNIENNYVTTSTRDKMLNITKEIKCYKKYVEKYNHIYEELKNKEYLGYTNIDDLYFTVINGDTIEIKIHEKKPFGFTGTNGIYIYEGINNAEDIGILLKDESYNISHPTSKVILKSIQQNDSINGNDFRLLVHQKIEKYQNIIEEYNTILENELTISFGDFIIYNIFNSSITGNKTHILIRLIFLLQAIIITFFSGYIYQTLYKMLDGEEKYIKIQNMKDKENSKKNKTFTRDFWWYLSIFIAFIFIICCFPALFTQPGRLDFSNTGEIGDTIGGIMGPFVAIAAAILTFLAFWVQFKANEQQKNDITRERFENQFNILLGIYKDATNNINIPSVGKNKEAFHFLFYEYQTLLIFFYILYKNHNNKYEEIDKKKIDDLSSLAISFLMCGITNISNDRIKQEFSLTFDESFIKTATDLVSNLQKINSKQISSLSKIKQLTLFESYLTNSKIKWFWGMRSNLIPYLNSVNILIYYVEIFFQDKEDKKEKNLYYNIIYAQMSEHELGLLYAFYHTKLYRGNINSYFFDYIMQDCSKLPDMYKYDLFLKDLNENHELQSKIYEYLKKNKIYKEPLLYTKSRIYSTIRSLIKNLFIRK